MPSPGTSFSAIEAMYFGCAVVTTWVGGLASLVQDGENGLLIAPVAGELEAALARLIEDAGLRERVGRRAMDSVLSRHGIGRWRGRVTAILERALGLRGDGGAP